jgi:hypothetical protein
MFNSSFHLVGHGFPRRLGQGVCCPDQPVGFGPGSPFVDLRPPDLTTTIPLNLARRPAAFGGNGPNFRALVQRWRAVDPLVGQASVIDMSARAVAPTVH